MEIYEKRESEQSPGHAYFDCLPGHLKWSFVDLQSRILELFDGVHLSLISLIGHHLDRHNQLGSVLSPNWYRVLV